ncbi:MAG: hypothetical protein KJ995_03100 [Candidatus Omnitrophica bacterium]|nr:hypothetical protein [Candidatus Omnitrophota bacterium]MBU1127863.1 hypothetical protein [Candidatus Omnitrophota bacterium]MBU1656937.1 hypothetical protein [Candidatus Omnitrophota bacterium]MBU1784171.1 hypothetical protein [Candidatus Omnitrophota bacterium]MBU1851374.1 hypothetical protein [Candidatus Omnitrophota bacterium]
MKQLMDRGLYYFSAIALLCVCISGCGYSSSALLASGLDSVHVDNFVNGINPTREISDRRNSYSYRPALENDITRAVINGFIFNRHLELQTKDNAALRLEGTLVDFRQYPLTYSDDYNIEEFRMEVFVDVSLYNNKTGELMWEEKSFMGETNYYVAGPNRITESQAEKRVVQDLALRIVERTVETWQ